MASDTLSLISNKTSKIPGEAVKLAQNLLSFLIFLLQPTFTKKKSIVYYHASFAKLKIFKFICTLHFDKINAFSIHTLSDLGVSGNLIGSLSQHYSLPVKRIMHDPNKTFYLTSPPPRLHQLLRIQC